MFPTIPNKKQDFRFISHDHAVKYLKDTFIELENTLSQSGADEDCKYDSGYSKENTTLYKTLVRIEEKF